MPELVDEHDDAEADEAEDYRSSRIMHSISLTAASAASRARPSISNILSRSRAREGQARSRVSATTRAISTIADPDPPRRRLRPTSSAAL